MSVPTELQEVEMRLARERADLAALARNLGETARDAVATPRNLLGVAAFGFLLGEMLQSRRGDKRPRRRRGLAGLLLGAGIAVLRARYGSPFHLARELWMRAPEPTRRSRRYPVSAGGGAPRPSPAGVDGEPVPLP